MGREKLGGGHRGAPQPPPQPPPLSPERCHPSVPGDWWPRGRVLVSPRGILPAGSSPRSWFGGCVGAAAKPKAPWGREPSGESPKMPGFCKKREGGEGGGGFVGIEGGLWGARGIYGVRGGFMGGLVALDRHREPPGSSCATRIVPKGMRSRFRAPPPVEPGCNSAAPTSWKPFSDPIDPKKTPTC